MNDFKKQLMVCGDGNKELSNSDTLCKLIIEYAKNNNLQVDTVIWKLALRFAKKLPYSLDKEDSDFLPCDFLFMGPSNPNIRLFKENSNILNAMIGWGDTKRSGYLLQLFSIFQKMLQDKNFTISCFGELSGKYKDIDIIINSDYTNRYTNIIENSLPKYYNAFLAANKNAEKRKEVLDDMFEEFKYEIGSGSGDNKLVFVADSVVEKQRKRGFNFKPGDDLEMLLYFNGVNLDDDANVDSLIKKIQNLYTSTKDKKNCDKDCLGV